MVMIYGFVLFPVRVDGHVAVPLSSVEATSFHPESTTSS